jgi:uncharacterized protein YceH (UPF0502 family)
MSLNALITGCNQKSNRDPVMSLTDVDVEEALADAQQKGLAIRLTGGGRVEKWKHNLYEAWDVSKAEMAVLCELLLRGPQTEGELRGRVSRMEPMDDLDALRAVLKPLAERRLVVYLTPEGRRGTMLTHGFHGAGELERLKAVAPTEAPSVSGSASGMAAALPRVDHAALELQLQEVRRELAELRGRLADVQAEMTRVNEQVRKIMDGLGL